MWIMLSFITSYLKSFYFSEVIVLFRIIKHFDFIEI